MPARLTTHQRLARSLNCRLRDALHRGLAQAKVLVGPNALYYTYPRPAP